MQQNMKKYRWFFIGLGIITIVLSISSIVNSYLDFKFYKPHIFMLNIYNYDLLDFVAIFVGLTIILSCIERKILHIK